MRFVIIFTLEVPLNLLNYKNKIIMKKKLLFGVFGCLFGLWQIRAQNTISDNPQDSVPYNYVLLEDFSGTWCNSCPQLADSLAALEKDFEKLSIIGYQLGEIKEEVSFFYNMDSYGRSGYYDTVRSIPSLFVNGSNANIYKPRPEVEKAFRKKTTYRLELTVSHIPNRAASRDSFQINVKVNCSRPDNSRQIRLHLAFTQDHFAFQWYNQIELNHALTFMYPDKNGTEVLLDETGHADFSFGFGIDYSKSRFPVKNGTITAFLQDQTILRYDTLADRRIRAIKDNTILQVDKAYLGNGAYTQLNEGDIQDADFHSRNPEIADRQSARFYDNTFGTVDAYHWEFEGGNPAVSDLATPKVFYEKPGNYAATLTVTKNGKTSSIRKENAVSVLDVQPKFVIEPATARPYQTVKIHLVSLADECSWKFPGGSTFTATGKDVTTSYSYEGLFDIEAEISYKSPRTGRTYSLDSTAREAISINRNATANNRPDKQETIRIISREGGRFMISGTKGNFEYADVFSLNGQHVARFQSEDFDLAFCPSGIYIVCVKLQGNMPVSIKIHR